MSKYGGESHNEDRDLQLAINYLLTHPSVKVVAVIKGRVVGEEAGEGLQPLMALIDKANELSTEGIRGASVADRVIGEAAAVLLIDEGVAGVFGEILSVGAEARLKGAGIPMKFNQRVDHILARDGQNKCFMERQVEHTPDVQEAVKRLRRVIG